MNPLQPLILKLEIDTQNLERVQKVIDQCNELINNTPLNPCPSCGSTEHVTLSPWTHQNPEHDDTAIIAQCQKCELQTRPQYWFIRDPESVLSALQTVFAIWNHPLAEQVQL